MSAEKKFVYTIQAQYKGNNELNKLKVGLQTIGNIKSFDRLSTSIGKTKGDLAKAEVEAEKLKQALDGTHDKKAAADAKKAEKAVDSLNKKLAKESAELAKLDASLRKTGINTSKLAAEQNKLQRSMQSRGNVIAARNALEIRSTREIKTEILALSKAYATLKNSGTASMGELSRAKEKLRAKTLKLNKELGKVPGIFSKSAKGMRSLHGMALSLSAMFGGFGAAMFARSIFDAGVSSQQLAMAFESIYGSGEKAAAELEFLKRVADELGQEYQSLAKSYKVIAAAAKGTDLEGNSTRQFVVAIAESAKVLGATSDQINRAFAQIGQGISRGKFELEDLKTIAEALPGIGFKDFADSIGVSTEKFYEMISAGEIVADDFIPKLSKALHGQFAEAAKESETAQQALNRMTNAWYDLRVEIANSGFLDRATNYMEALTNALKDPQVQQAAKDLADTIFALGEGLFKIGFFAKAAFETVASGILSVVQYGAGMISMFAMLTDTLGITTGAFEELQQISKAAEEGAIDLAGKAVNSWQIMGKGVSGYASKAKKSVSVIEETFSKIEGAAEKSAAGQVKVTKDALKEMKKEYKDLQKEVESIQDDIQKRAAGLGSGAGIGSLTAELREMSRTNMTDLQAWRDKKKEAAEYVRAAKAASVEAERMAKAGNYAGAKKLFEQAVEYADEAKSAYKDLNEEVKQNDQVVISSQKALKTSMAGVKASGELAIDILKDQEAATKKAMAALDKEAGGKLSGKEAIEETTAAADGLEQKIVKVGDRWEAVWKDNRKDGIAVLDALQTRVDSMDGQTIKVYVEEIAKHRWGGMAGKLSMANVLRFAAGGKLAGYGGGDKIRALLEAGEFVVRKEAVAKYGPGFLHALNSMRFNFGEQVRARVGGYISNVTAPVLMQSGGLATAGASGQSMGHYTHDINFQGAPAPVRVMTDRQNTAAFINGLKRMQELAS